LAVGGELCVDDVVMWREGGDEVARSLDRVDESQGVRRRVVIGLGKPRKADCAAAFKSGVYSIGLRGLVVRVCCRCLTRTRVGQLVSCVCDERS
jgi:hypothetical protein